MSSATAVPASQATASDEWYGPRMVPDVQWELRHAWHRNASLSTAAGDCHRLFVALESLPRINAFIGPTRSTELPTSVETQAHDAKVFLREHLGKIGDDITAVYAETETDGVRVSILLRDIWGPVSEHVYAVMYQLRKTLDLPNVDVVVLPAEAVGDSFAQDEDMDHWL